MFTNQLTGTQGYLNCILRWLVLVDPVDQACLVHLLLENLFFLKKLTSIFFHKTHALKECYKPFSPFSAGLPFAPGIPGRPSRPGLP